MNVDLTHGSIFRGLLRFSLPLMAGNLLQQLYNLVDTFVVGRYCGEIALAAVGSAFSVMILLTSIVTGLCMGSGVVVSQLFGQKDDAGVRKAVGNAFVLIAGVSALLTILSYALLPVMMTLLRIPPEAQGVLSRYLLIVFIGIIPTFLYNFGACMLRAVGNSTAPLVFLLISSLTNVALDFLFVAVLPWGVAGAAVATLISQVLSGFLCLGYVLFRVPALTPSQHDLHPDRALFRRIFSVSAMTSIQQSIMNFGILMVQGLVNSFGTVIMAAFAAAVKIDSFAYMPVQDFGNAFSTYVAQNYGAGQTDRIRKGIRSAGLCSAAFCIVISVLVCAFAAPLMGIFIDPAETAILAAGVHYLHIEGACYLGIGILFLLYGYYRAVNQPQMSVVLTIASLGTRVALAYLLSATPLGVTGIWLSVPIGWALADAIGIGYYLKKHRAKYAVQA